MPAFTYSRTSFLKICVFVSLFNATSLWGNIHPEPALRSFKCKIINPASFNLKDKLSAYTIFQLDIQALNDSIRAAQEEALIELSVGRHHWILALRPNDILAPGYNLVIEENGIFNTINRPRPNAYLGYEIQDGGKAGLVVNANFMEGFVIQQNSMYYIEPLTHFYKDAPVYYFVVHTGHYELNEDLENSTKNDIVSGHVASGAACGSLDLEIAIASDKSMFTKYGSVLAVENHNIAVLNNAQALFSGVFTQDINFEIVTQYVVVGSDPWGVPNDMNDYLSKFKTWANSGNLGVPYDLAGLWTNMNALAPAGTGSLGYLGSLCTTNKYHLVKDNSNDPSMLRYNLTQAIGYNLGAFYDANCPPDNYLMCPSVSSPPNTWSPGSISAINAFVAGKIGVGCLSGMPAVGINNLSANGLSGTFTLAGGQPQIDGSNYTSVSMTLQSNPGVTSALMTAPFTHGETVSFTCPQAGDYDLVVTDNNGCGETKIVAVFTPPCLTWQKALGGSSNDGAESVLPTPDGGYIMAGSTFSTNGDVSGNHGNEDVWIVKLNVAGKMQWQKTLGGTLAERAHNIQLTGDGGYIIAGYSDSNDGDVSGNQGGRDVWVVKLSATGDLQWQKTYGGSSYDAASTIQATADGGFIVAGASSSSDGDLTENQGNLDGWVFKINASGQLQWQEALGGSSQDYLHSPKPTADGGYILAGFTNSNGGDVFGNHGGGDIWVVKLTSNGALEWQKCLGGSAFDDSQSLVVAADGGYIIAGSSASNNGDVSGNHGGEDAWIVKLDATGALQWQKCLGGTQEERVRQITATPDGGYIVAGHSFSDDGDVSGNHGLKDAWIFKIDQNGALQWQKSLGGDAADYATAVQPTADNGYIVAGVTASVNGDVSGNHGMEDAWVVKLGDLPACVTLTTPLPTSTDVPVNTSIQWQKGSACTDGYRLNLGTTPGGSELLNDQVVLDTFFQPAQSLPAGTLIYVRIIPYNDMGVAGGCQEFTFVTAGGSGVDIAPPCIQWQNTIGGDYYDWLSSIQQTTDGGYILGGTSYSGLSGDKTESYAGYWVIKLNSTGDIQWQNTVGGSGIDQLYSIQQTTDGGYILGGFSNSNISGDKTENSQGGDDCWVVKLDPAGIIQWQNTIGGSSDDRLLLHSFQQTADNGYIIGSTSDSHISGDKSENSEGDWDYWVVKLNSAGTIQWQNTIGGSDGDEVSAIQQTADGGYILGGRSGSNISGDKTENSEGSWDYWVVKLDSAGTIQWQNTIGGSFEDGITSIQLTPDGGYLLGGYSHSNLSGDKTENSEGERDYWVVKLNPVGNVLWQKTIGGNSDDFLIDIQLTNDGGYLLGGWSRSNISGDKTENSQGGYDYWIVKLDAVGNIRWQKTIGGNGNDYIYSIQQTADSGFFFGGYSYSNLSGDKTENGKGWTDYWVIKLSPENPQIPTPSIMPAMPVFCVGDSVSLDAGGGFTTYQWSNNATTPGITVNMPGLYAVTVTSADGCTATDTVEVLQNNTLPVVSITTPNGAQITCAQSSVLLQAFASGTNTYTWTGPNGFTFSGPQPAVSNPGTYTVTVANSSTGCSDTASVVISLNNDPPGANATGGVITCTNPVILVQGNSLTSGVTYSWSGPNGFMFNGQNSPVNTAGNYTLTVTDPATGCTSSATANVMNDNVPPSATVSAPSGSQITCTNAFVALQVPAVGGYNYSWSGGLGNNPAAVAVLPGTYTITVTNPATGCSATGSATVTEDKTIPNIAATGGELTCAQNFVILQGSSSTPGVTYLWTGPNGFAVAQSNPPVNVPGTYTFTVSNPENGCTATATATVGEDKTPPGISATGGQLSCQTLTVELSGDSGTPGATMSWTGPGGFVFNGPNPVVNLPGAYTLTVTNPLNGCTAVQQVTVDPPLVLTPVVSGSTKLCPGSTLTLTAESGYTVYEWSTGDTAAQITVNQPGAYTVTVTDANQCTGTKTVSVTPAQPPNPVITGPPSLCIGSSIMLDAGAGYTGYNWSTGQNTQSISVNEAGTYTVTVTDTNGCTGVASKTITSMAAPNPGAGSNSPVCAGEQLKLFAGSSAGWVYNWTGPGGFVSTAQNPVRNSMSADMAGLYIVTVTDGNNCTGTASVAVHVAPNYFLENDTVVCTGNTLLNGKPVTVDTTIQQIFTTSLGCDSISILAVDVVEAQAYIAVTDTFFCPPGQGSIIHEFEPVTNDNTGGNSWKIGIEKDPVAGIASVTDDSLRLLYQLQDLSFRGLDTIVYRLCDANCDGPCSIARIYIVVQDDIKKVADDLPNGFTPNGDGINDFFNPLQNYLDQNYIVPTGRASLTIINRWGEIVYQANPYQYFNELEGGWDGRNGNGSAVIPGTYYYMLRLDVGETVVVKGAVQVLTD
ncbi:MAG: hypothetical protein EPGJADBJ_03402 [Saprospiraceae bacterium]|nr:hypothetical protein [Saprospiraceae bacterium]